MKTKLQKIWNFLKVDLTPKKLILIMLGSMILSFGIHNIHKRTAITEGGIMGLMLLIEHWFDISPAYITPALDVICYLIAFKILGGQFIKMSAVATIFISIFYKIWELFPPMLPDLSAYPLVASILGALFVGVGFGLVVKQGGSGSGDDALALTISKVLKIRLSFAYLFTDVTVLLLSLTYIPLTRIIFSLITVTISSFIIDFIKTFKIKKKEIKNPTTNENS